MATPAPTSSAGSPDAGGTAAGGQLTEELGDPANTYGPPLLSRLPSTWLVLDRGFPLLVAADSGTRLTSAEGTEPQSLVQAVISLVNHLRRHRTRINTTVWNGEAATRGPWRG